MSEIPARADTHPLPADATGPPLLGPAEDELDLRHYWYLLKKRAWLVVVFSASIVFTVGLFSVLATPIYTAETVLLIEPSSPNVIDIDAVLSDSLGPGEDFYKTQYEILQSRSLAAQVISEERLGEMAQGSDEDTVFAEERPQFGIGAGLFEDAHSRPDALSSVDPELIDDYLDELGVDPVRKSRLVKVSFDSPDPALSARVVNAHARAYIRRGLMIGTRASEEARRFLAQSLGELRARLEASEAALGSYRREHGIISLDDKENLVVDRLADLNGRLTETEAKRIGLEAEVRIIQERDYDALPAIIRSPLVRTLKERLAALEGDYAKLNARFKSGYPPLVQLRAEIETRRGQLQTEVRSIVAGVESAYLTAVSEERELRTRFEAQKAEALRLKDASVEYAILARDVDTDRTLYENVLQRMNETGMAAELRASNVFVIDQAQPPRRAAYPRKGRNLGLALLLGLIGGIGLAFAADYLDNTLRTPQDVDRYVNLPSLGVVPDFLRLGSPAGPRLALSNGSASTGSTDGVPLLAEDPLSAAADAYRTIRTSILFSQAGEPPGTILFTSAGHGEGKTATVLHSAVSFSQLGGRVLVIDADLRRPSCHTRLGVEIEAGLTEVLTGQSETAATVLDAQTLALLPAGATPPNPTELLGSDRMRDVLGSLRKQYDFILIDAPPLMPVSDTVVLSTLVDGAVLVVDQQHTPRQAVRMARERLSQVRTRILGVVLNRVDPREDGSASYLMGYA